MSRIEVLHWTPSHYLTDYKTGHLDLTEHGAYMLLLWHMWLDSECQCEFPYDFRALASIWDVSPEEAERLSGVLTDASVGVMRVRVRRAGRFLYSKRLAEQVRAAESSRQKKSDAGKESGRIRRENARNTCSTPVQHPLNESELTVVPYLGSPDVSEPVVQNPSLKTLKVGVEAEKPEPTIVYAEAKWHDGEALTKDEARSVRRWVKVYGGYDTRAAIGDAKELGHDGDLDYIGGLLKRLKAGGG